MDSITEQVERLPWRVLLPMCELTNHGVMATREDQVSVVCDLEHPHVTVMVMRAARVVSERVAWLHNEALKRGDILAKTP